MTIAKAITDFTDVLERAKLELAGVNGGIDVLLQEKARIERAPPHTDDIVATFMRGLAGTADDFTRQLKSHLAETYLGSDGAAASAASEGRSAHLLTVEAHKPDREALLTRSLRSEPAALNQAALTYLLRESIKAEIPALVDRLCPAARNGMKRADRVAALNKVEGELAVLNEEARALEASLQAARAAVTRR